MDKGKGSEYWEGVKKERKRTITAGICAGLTCFVLGTGAGFMIRSNFFNDKVKDPYAQKIIEAYNIIKDNWLFGKDIENLDSIASELMINGLLDNDGDPFTFYTKDEASQGLSTSGYGFGVSFANYYGRPLIHTMHNGTMVQCGLLEGDIIKSYAKNNGTVIDTYEKGYQESLSELSGQKYDEFDFVVIRNGVEMTFDDVPVGDYTQKTVWLVSDTTTDGSRKVEIRINTFLGSPSVEFRTLVDSLLQKGAIDTLLIDLKNNGGGYVNEMQNLVSYFVPKGTTIFSMTDRSGAVIERVVQGDNPRYTSEDIKDVRIVQNGGTASASESFGLALQDTDIATVYGTQSYGKGIAQTFYTFSDGSVIRYTYAYIYGPNGNSIHNVGITPDNPTDQDYYVINGAPTYNENPSYYTTTLTNQLTYYGYEGTLEEMLKEFQEDHSLTSTGTYNTETYNYLAGYNYDNFWREYKAENEAILNG